MQPEASDSGKMRFQGDGELSYGYTVGVLLSNALSFSLALLERVLVLELGTHI